MTLYQPRGVVDVGEPIAKCLYCREAREPEQLLLPRPGEFLRDTAALRLTHEGGRALDRGELDLVLKIIGMVIETVVVAWTTHPLRTSMSKAGQQPCSFLDNP
jgi:hypothetical protein